MSDRVAMQSGPALNGGICPICQAERKKQKRRKTVRPNRILAEHPNHGGQA